MNRYITVIFLFLVINACKSTTNEIVDLNEEPIWRCIHERDADLANFLLKLDNELRNCNYIESYGDYNELINNAKEKKIIIDAYKIIKEVYNQENSKFNYLYRYDLTKCGRISECINKLYPLDKTSLFICGIPIHDNFIEQFKNEYDSIKLPQIEVNSQIHRTTILYSAWFFIYDTNIEE